MGVVTRYTAGFPNPNNVSAYSCVSHERISTLRSSFFNIAVASGDAVGSMYYLARLPSFAMLKPGLSTLVSTGIAGLTGLSIGLTNEAGTQSDAALMAAADVHAAGSFNPFAAISGANLVQRLWQVLGLAADPHADLDIYAKITAGPATGAGTLIGDLVWSQPGL
jgi:hypothetical protein